MTSSGAAAAPSSRPLPPPPPDNPFRGPDLRSARPAYSKSQLEAYTRLISLSEPYRSSPILAHPHLAREKAHGLPFLTALMRFHQAKVPYENLSLHYSPSSSAGREPSLNADDLFDRIVRDGRNRGGHCLQLNAFFAHALRGFGFDVTTSAARVSTDCQSIPSKPELPRYNGWDHMILIIELSGSRYLVDVGMKGQGPMVPVPLPEKEEEEEGEEKGEATIIPSIPPRSIRLIRNFLPESTSRRRPAQRHWQLQQRWSDTSPWTCVHAFPDDVECLPSDFEVVNYFVSTHRTGWLTHKVTVGKMLLGCGGEGEGQGGDEAEIIGEVVLHGGVLKKRVRGRKELEIVCRDEAERLRLLEEYFGISLEAREKEGIRGTVAELA